MIADDILDVALGEILSTASQLDLTTTECRTFADVAAGSIGYRRAPTLIGPQAGERGRQIVIAQIDDGVATKRGEPKYWCLTGMSLLLACGELSRNPDRPVVLVPGIAFLLPSIRIRLVSGAH